MPVLSLLVAAACLQNPGSVSERIASILSTPIAARGPAAEILLADLKRTGTPAYEEIDAGTTLATFVFEGDEKTAVAAVVADFGDSWTTHRMSHVEGTKLWYRSYKLPSDSRFYYAFSASDKLPAISEEATWLYAPAVKKGDPLNPLGITIGRDQHFSFAILPKSPKLPIYDKRDTLPQGKFEPSRTSSFRFPSKKLGDHRVWLYISAGFLAGKPTDLIVFLDGSGRFQLMDSITLLDNMVADKKLGQTVAIYTDSPNRDRDLTCSPEYLSFLIDELMPFVRDRYKVKLTPKRTVINGASLGGLFAAYAVYKRPDVFGGALMQSPSLWWHPADEPADWLTRQFAASKKASGRFFVSPGSFERVSVDPDATGILYSSRWFRDVLSAKGAQVQYREVHGGHDPLCWQVSLPEGIEYLLGRS